MYTVEKLAASALRKRLHISRSSTNPNYFYASIFTGSRKEPIGTFAISDSGQVNWADIKDKFAGTGLGRKIYTELLRLVSKESTKKYPLTSDSIQSGLSRRVYMSLGRGGKKSVGRKRGSKPNFVEERTGVLPITSGGKGPVVKMYRPGSAADREQAARMIAAGRPAEEWGLSARIARWKKANRKHSDIQDDLLAPRFVDTSSKAERSRPSIQVKSKEEVSPKSFRKAMRAGSLSVGLDSKVLPRNKKRVREILDLQHKVPADLPSVYSYVSKHVKKNIPLNQDEIGNITRDIQNNISRRFGKKIENMSLAEQKEVINKGNAEAIARVRELPSFKEALKKASKKDKTLRGMHHVTSVEPVDATSVRVKMYSPAHKLRITNDKMKQYPPNLVGKYVDKVQRAQKPHGPRKKEGPALDYGNNN